MFSNISIKRVNKTIIIIFTLAIATVTVAFFFNTYNEHKKELKEIENNFIKEQKEYVKNETLRAIRYIDYIYNRYKDKVSKKELKAKIVETIEHNRDISRKDGYVFIYDFNGINIADPIQKSNSGKNLINFKDSNGKYVIKELIDVAKKGGGYVDYVWIKPTTKKPAKKISYATAFKPLEWMVGSGVYLDNINRILAKKKSEYSSRITYYMVQILLMLLILFILTIMLSSYFFGRVKKDVDITIKAIKDIPKNYNKIDISTLKIREFKTIAISFNKMVGQIEELQENLELKIKQRTKQLEISEKRARALVEDQDRFIKTSIHEINTPLSIIITNIDLFKMRYGQNRYLSKIEAASKIIHNLYNDLSYCIRRDRLEQSANSIDFSAFLYDRIDYFSEVAIGNALSFKAEIEDDIDINFNLMQLQRLCDNTITNAIKYSYKNGTITIGLKKEKNSIIFWVKNRGKDIKDTAKIFERYYRENRIKGGFGLGLNIVNDICIRNNIEVKVSSIDSITTFEYRFSI